VKINNALFDWILNPDALDSALPVPLCFMPLVDDLSLVRGVGSATFTRATIKNVTDRITKLVSEVAINDAGFEVEGYLDEGDSSNLNIRSEEFNDGHYSKQGSSISADFATGPNGTSNADKLIENSAPAEHFAAPTISFTSGVAYTWSIYVKAQERSIFWVRFSGGPFGSERVFFDLSTGTVGTEDVGATGKITALANGWFRVTATATASSTASGGTAFGITTTDGLTSYLGDGTSGMLYFGAMVEALPFASSYTKTLASPVSRTRDDLSIDAANIPGPTADYSISALVDVLGIIGANQRLMTVVGESNRFILAANASSKSVIIHGGAFEEAASVASIVPNTPTKITGTVDSSDIKLYFNNILSSRALGTTPTGTKTSIAIGSNGAGGQNLNGHIKKLRIDNVALTADQEVAL